MTIEGCRKRQTENTSENTSEKEEHAYACENAGQAGSFPNLFPVTESESEKPPGSAHPPFRKNGASASTLDRPNKQTKKNSSTLQSKIPDIEEFVAHGLARGGSDQDCRDLYQIWIDNDWCDGFGNKIIRWKGKLTTFIKKKFMPSDQGRWNSNSAGTFTPKKKGFVEI